MVTEAISAPPSLATFLRQDAAKDLLRFSTAGSVDNGKSTLIGRLLYDSRALYEDQLASVKRSRFNRAQMTIDFALLTDGLRAEREQGITIDVAYRYFATSRRKFIISDTPGHEQYTRNMVTGASTADLAIVLLDARHGVSVQSKRHAYVASLLGIPHIVVAVNKMDLVGYSEEVFENIRANLRPYLAKAGVREAGFIPISALHGENVARRSGRMRWYGEASLLEHLESVAVSQGSPLQSLRLPVQYVLRPNQNFRGYAGQIASGQLRVGDPVAILPLGCTSRVRAIPSFDGELSCAAAPMSVTVCLEDELDIGRGDMFVDPRHLPTISRNFQATLVWFHEHPLRLDHPYLLKHTAQQATARVTALESKVDVESLAQLPARELQMNEIGAVSIETNRPLYFDPYAENRQTGSFILIDLLTNATVAGGLIQNCAAAVDCRAQPSLASSQSPVGRVSAAERAERAGHRPAVICISGRRELAYRLERRLFQCECAVHVLEDAVASHGLAEMARILAAAGMIAIVSRRRFESEEQARTKALVGEEQFFSFVAEELGSDDDRAAQQICDRLTAARVIGNRKLVSGQDL